MGFLIMAYGGAIIMAHWLAYLIRFEFQPPVEQRVHFWRMLQWILPLELLALWAFGQFRSLLSYFSLPDVRRIVLACGSAAAVSLAVWYATKGQYAPPRSIILLSFLLDTAALGSVRLAFRTLRERQGGNDKSPAPQRRMVIIGAGDVGANLAKEMKLRRDLRMTPIAFFDDDRSKWNTHIHGVPVVGRPEVLADGKMRIDEAIIAMPSASGRRVREVVQVLNETGIRFETVPSFEQMVNGSVKVSQIRPVQIEDLLGRDRVILETERIQNLVKDKVVMITGAGGSIGSELCRQIVGYHPLRLLLVERCEVQIFQIEQELLELGYGSVVTPLVADIRDEQRMRSIFERFQPEIVFHAAAHKHVPMMEHQPYEAFQNNTMGTKCLAKLSVESKVERFVLISTDKAINPTNVMGATKRLAELYIQALQRELRSKAENVGLDLASVPRESQSERAGRTSNVELQTLNVQVTSQTTETITVSAQPKLTKFIAVRFGNVLGSSGSVIPTFKKQIAAGGPVAVTHPEVTRYFMTVQEAVGLVLQSATQGQGGEIFVLDMGRPVKIADLARQLIELSGLKPDIDIEIKFSGLRPGEKLFEELNHNTEDMVATDHPKIMRFIGEPMELAALSQGLLRVHEKSANLDGDQVKREIQKLVPEYKPYFATV